MQIITDQTQSVIDLDDRNVVLISGERMGMYCVFGVLSITWEEILVKFLDEQLDLEYHV